MQAMFANWMAHAAQAEWAWALFVHFLSLSLLAVGGGITTAPDMHRFIVSSKGWLSEGEFSASIALAQAAPGPNILFVAALGWQIGTKIGTHMGLGLPGLLGTWGFGLLGMGVAMLGIMLPSSVLAIGLNRWLAQHEKAPLVLALKAGLAPLAIAMLLATAWLLLGTGIAVEHILQHWRTLVLALVCLGLVYRTKVHILWVLGLGCVAGLMGWV